MKSSNAIVYRIEDKLYHLMSTVHKTALRYNNQIVYESVFSLERMQFMLIYQIMPLELNIDVGKQLIWGVMLKIQYLI